MKRQLISGSRPPGSCRTEAVNLSHNKPHIRCGINAQHGIPLSQAAKRAMRGLRTFLPVFFLSVLLPCIAPSAHAQRSITLGNATVPLDGLWKFRTGDNLAWAQPNFDDAAWGTMDLTPPPGSYDPLLGSSGYLTGWTARGYRGYSGYAWYRLRINLQDGQTRLALKLPDAVDDAYQVYVNGKRIGEFGRFTARGVTAILSQPRAFLLPDDFRGGPVTLAI